MGTRSGIAPEGAFDRPLENREGIYYALAQRPRVPLAQRSNFWPLTAMLYEPLWRKRSISLLTSGAFSTARELEVMLTWLEPQAGGRILDAGASAGLYARTLLTHTSGLEVHALDFSLPFLERANRYAKRDGVAPILVHADVGALPYRDAMFDAVVCGGSLNEFTDLHRTLAELARVLKPGGQVFLMALLQAKKGVGSRLQQLLSTSGLQFFSDGQLAEVALELGLKRIQAQIYPPVSLEHYRLEKP